MTTQKVDKSRLVSGSTTLLLLQLLSERPMYGYEMIDTLQNRSQNVFELKYPLLHSMEQKKMLESYEKEVDGKRRKYYQITKAGMKHLDSKKRKWETYRNAVQRVLGGAAYDAVGIS